MMWDSGSSDSDGDDKVEKLSFICEETLEQSTIFQFVLSSCKAKFNTELARLFDGIDAAAFSVLTDFDDELRAKFSHEDEETRERLTSLAGSFVNKIQDWMKYINKHVFYPKGEHPVRAIDFLHCVVISDRGMIDYEKTARNLIAEENITRDDKLKVACMHCLEDEITKISEGRDFSISGKLCKETKRMVEFWKTLILEKKYSENAENLIQIVGRDNACGLEFFFEKLTEKQKSRVIVELFRIAGVDLQVEWLNRMTKEQQQYVMKKCGGYVLINLMKDAQWSRYFYEVAIFARYLLTSKHYFEVIKAASSGVPYSRFFYPLYDIHLEAFHFMWKRAPKHVKDYVYQQEDSLNFFWFLRKVEDYGFFKRFFTRASQAYKRKFFDSWKGLEVLSLIHTENDDVKLFHEIVESAFPDKEEAFELKMRFMSEELGCYILDDAVEKRNVELFEKKLKEVFLTDEYVEKFKRRYLYDSKCCSGLDDSTKKVFFVDRFRKKIRSVLIFDEIVEYIRWYLSEEEIETFKKTRLCDVQYLKRIFIHLMKIDRYDLVDAFLNWSFNDDQLIVEYKKKFYTEELKREFVEFVFDSVMKKDEFETLTKFDSWCSMPEENHRQMGDAVLNDTKKMQPVWRYMLYDEHFQMADDFLKWCGKTTVEEVRMAKNKLFVDVDWKYLIYGVQTRYEVMNLKEVTQPEVREMLTAKTKKMMDWFDASEEAYVSLASKALEEEGYVLKKRKNKKRSQ